MDQPEHVDSKCPICQLAACQNDHFTKTNVNTSNTNKCESCLTKEYQSEDNFESNINNYDYLRSIIENNMPCSHSGSKMEQSGEEVTENIAHILKTIGDNLDATANDGLSNDIVLALRNIGDKLDVKLGFQKQSFVMAALGASRISIGHVFQELLKPQSLVGTVICTSLQLLLHYKRL